MIKSNIDARERALELATSFCKGVTMSDEIVTRCAKNFTLFLVGDVELPETQSDTELVKAFLEVMNSELDKKCKPMPDYLEMLKAFQKGNAGLSAEMPCKSEVE